MTEKWLTEAFNALDAAAPASELDPPSQIRQAGNRRRRFRRAIGGTTLLLALAGGVTLANAVAGPPHAGELLPVDPPSPTGNVPSSSPTSPAASPEPSPAGYLAGPGPDVLEFFGHYTYVKTPPAGARPTVSPAAALQVWQRRNPGLPAPRLALGSFTNLPRPRPALPPGTKYPTHRGTLVWVLRSPMNSTAAGNAPHGHGWTYWLVIDANTGAILLDTARAT